MLRKKLVINLAPVVLLLVGAGVTVLLLLQHVLGQLDHAEGADQVREVARDFRWVVWVLSIAFLVIVNGTVLVLMRMGMLILRPMDKLLAATKALAQERFDTRVHVDGNDEFNQLGRALNGLAEQLALNDKRRMEVLQQVGVAINHELNNCVATIDLQLRLAGRYLPDCPGLEKSLRQIDDSLRRITGAVQSLRNVRRIVLTDYLPGTKMLDLQRSAEADELSAQAPKAPEATPRSHA